MPVWTFAVGPWTGAPRRELTVAQGRKITFRRRGGATLGFNIDGRHPEALELEELVTDIHGYRDGVKLFRGRVGPAVDDVGETTHEATITAGDYRNVLERRFIFDGDAILETTWSIDSSHLVAMLVALTQGRPSGELGITLGQGFPDSGRNAPDVEFSAGQSIAKAIDTFAETDVSTTGFDWEVDAELVLNVWPGKRGSDSGTILDYGGAVAKVKRTSEAAKYANVLRANGAQDAMISTTIEAPDLATRPEGRWETQVGYTDVKTLPLLEETAAREFAKLTSTPPSYVATLTAGRWEGPGHIWLGDTVDLHVRSGRLNLVEELVVEEVGISLSDEGTETVELTLGSDFPGFARRLAVVEDRIRTLERT